MWFQDTVGLPLKGPNVEFVDLNSLYSLSWQIFAHFNPNGNFFTFCQIVHCNYVSVRMCLHIDWADCIWTAYFKRPNNIILSVENVMRRNNSIWWTLSLLLSLSSYEQTRFLKKKLDLKRSDAMRCEIVLDVMQNVRLV